MNKIIEALNATENLRNFTILSDDEVHLPGMGIDIRREGDDVYRVVEYYRDANGLYDVMDDNTHTEGGLLNWINHLDSSMSNF